MNLKLTTRISITIIVFLTLIFSTFCFVFYTIQKKEIIKTVDDRMQQGVRSMVISMDAFCEGLKYQNKIDSLNQILKKDTLSKGVPSTKSILLIDQIMSNEDNYKKIKKLYDRKYYSAGYPFLISKNGTFLIHPNKEKESATDKNFFKLITANIEKIGHERYLWPEDKTGKWKHEYFAYYAPLDAYIVCTCNESDIYNELSVFTEIMLFGGLITIVLLSIAIFLVFNPIKRVLKNMSGVIQNLSLGRVVSSDLQYSYNDEIAVINHDLNNLIEGVKNYSTFAKRIGENDLNAEFSLLSEADVLGKSLLEMKTSLKKATEEEILRKAEDDKRNWATAGAAKFAEILRLNNDNIQCGEKYC